MNKKILTVVAISVLSILVLSNIGNKKSNDKKMADSAAMITNMQGNSGGTGVVLSSSNNESLVLTNAHVCGVVKEGGIVSTNTKRSLVSSYQISRLHDLCMIKVKTNLNVNTKVSSESPEVYTNATVSGHPSLMPTVLTKGHFSDHEFITIVVGFRECTEEDLKNGLDAVCIFLGGIPLVKDYESQLVSSTIMPGSSGSAVFNDKGEIAGLVFAGSGSLSYGHIVPQEYVQYFVKEEIKTLEEKLPEFGSVKRFLKASLKLEEACSSPLNTNFIIVKEYCNYINLDLIKK